MASGVNTFLSLAPETLPASPAWPESPAHSHLRVFPLDFVPEPSGLVVSLARLNKHLLAYVECFTLLLIVGLRVLVP